MTKRDVLSIALKILGVVSLAYGIVCIPNLVMIAGAPSENFYPKTLFVWGQAVVIMLYAAVACWLIVSSDSFSSRMIKDDNIIEFPESLSDKKNVFNLALKVLGVVFSVQGIGNLAHGIGEIVLSNTKYAFAAMEWSQILTIVVYLGIGAYFLLGSGQFAALIYGRQPESERIAND